METFNGDVCIIPSEYLKKLTEGDFSCPIRSTSRRSSGVMVDVLLLVFLFIVFLLFFSFLVYPKYEEEHELNFNKPPILHISNEHLDKLLDIKLKKLCTFHQEKQKEKDLKKEEEQEEDEEEE